MAQRNPYRIAQLALVGALITFIIVNVTPTIWETYRYKPKVDPLAEFRNILKGGITSVEFSAASNCKKQWVVRLEASELDEFLSHAPAVDTDVMRSHIQRIHEARALISTKSQSLEYLAIVSAQQPQDLLLERTIVAPGAGGAPREWVYDEIRFPGLGKWLQQKTPEGAL